MGWKTGQCKGSFRPFLLAVVTREAFGVRRIPPLWLNLTLLLSDLNLFRLPLVATVPFPNRSAVCNSKFLPPG